MVEEVMGRTIATEAWKESTVHVISASARLDLVCLEGELELEAVLVIMVSFVLNDKFIFKSIYQLLQQEVEVTEVIVVEAEVDMVPIMGKNDQYIEDQDG